MYTQENDTKQFAFYQAGNYLVQTLLLHHPKISTLKITESSTNVFSFSPNVSLKESLSLLNKKAKLSSSLLTTIDLKTLLIGFYAGKAGEFFSRHTKKKTQYTSFCNARKGLFWYVDETVPVNKQKTKQSLIIPSFDYKKSTLTIKPRQNIIRLTDKRNCKRKQNKFVRTKALLWYVQSAQRSIHKYQLQREHCYSVLAPLNYLVLTKPLNYTKVNDLLYQSDTGSLERVKATFLANYVLRNQSTYFPNFINLQRNCKVGNLNKTEILDSKALDFFNNYQKQITNVFLKEIKKSSSVLPDKSLSDLDVYSTPLYNKKEFVTKKINLLSQKREISACCEEKVCEALMSSKKLYGHWFRLYLPQIETHQRQPVSRDQFFKIRFDLELFVYALNNIKYTQTHMSTLMPTLLIRDMHKRKSNSFVRHKSKAFVSACINEITQKRSFCHARPKLCHASLQLIHTQTGFVQPKTKLWPEKVEKGSLAKHDFGSERYFGVDLLPQEFGFEMCHNLILNSFSQALNLIGKNRELLDIVTDHLIRFEKIRVPEILRICLLYTDDNSLI